MLGGSTGTALGTLGALGALGVRPRPLPPRPRPLPAAAIGLSPSPGLICRSPSRLVVEATMVGFIKFDEFDIKIIVFNNNSV